MDFDTIHVAIVDQRLVQDWKTPPRNSRVDVMGQVKSGVVRNEANRWNGALTYVMGGEAAIVATSHTSVLSERAEAIHHSPVRHPRQEPDQQVEPWMTHQHETGEDQSLSRNGLECAHTFTGAEQTQNGGTQILPA